MIFATYFLLLKITNSFQYIVFFCNNISNEIIESWIFQKKWRKPVITERMRLRTKAIHSRQFQNFCWAVEKFGFTPNIKKWFESDFLFKKKSITFNYLQWMNFVHCALNRIYIYEKSVHSAVFWHPCTMSSICRVYESFDRITFGTIRCHSLSLFLFLFDFVRFGSCSLLFLSRLSLSLYLCIYLLYYVCFP